MITELSLENFKSWKSIDSMRLAPITGLFGANSSGKTSILQLLLMLKQTVDSPDRTQVLNLGGSKSMIELGSIREIFNEHDLDKEMLLNLSWIFNNKLRVPDPTKPKGSSIFRGKTLEYYCRLSAVNPTTLLVNDLSYFFSDLWFSMYKKEDVSLGYDLQVGDEDGEAVSENYFKFARHKGRAWPLPSPSKCYGFPDQVNTYYKNAAFLSLFELEFEKLFSNTYYLGPLREHPKRRYTWGGGRPEDVGQRGERAIDAILASRERGERISPGYRKTKISLEEYIARHLKNLGLVHDFKVKEIAPATNIFQVLVKARSYAPWVPLPDVGFGVSQVLPMLVMCYYVPEGSTIIMEQPEIHLHPSVQAGLADVFIDAINTRKIQIIVESHSEHLLRRLQRRIAEEKLKVDDTALYFCEVERGASKLTSLNIDEYGNIKNWPLDFFGDSFGEMAAMTKKRIERKRKASNG